MEREITILLKDIEFLKTELAEVKEALTNHITDIYSKVEKVHDKVDSLTKVVSMGIGGIATLEIVLRFLVK